MAKKPNKGKGRAGKSRGFSFRTTLGYIAGSYVVTNGVIAGIWGMGSNTIAAQSIAFAQLVDAYRFYRIHRVHLRAMPSFVSAAADLSAVGTCVVMGWVPEGSTAPNDVTDFETTAVSKLTQIGAHTGTEGTARPNPIELELGAEHFLGQTGGWYVTHSDATEPFLDTAGQVYLVLSDVTGDTARFYLQATLDVEFKEPLDPAAISLMAEKRLLARPEFLDSLKELIERATTEERGELLRKLLPSFK